MKNDKIFNFTTTFKSIGDDEDGSVRVRGMASTGDTDRAGDVIMPEAWTKGGLKHFEKNPIILFNHNYDRPIGRAIGLTVSERGLELEAKISKAEPQLAQLIKDGVLGTFSVGFRVKDADYISETDGLKIKDAELFEVSVVSVPCNQAATFSLSKSFNSMEEYKDYVKTFTNRVDLASQSLAEDESNLSKTASDTLDGANTKARKEIKMDKTPQSIDLEAFAKKVAEETAAKIAMKQAEEKATEKKAAEEAAKKAEAEVAEKAAQEAEVQSAIKFGIESGADRLMKDLNEKLAEKDAKIEEILKEFKTSLEEKNDELTKMRESRAVFADRGNGTGDLSKWGKDFMYGHMLGVMTGKGWNTAYGRNVLQKAGISYEGGSDAPDIAQEVSTQIEKEITLNLRTATLFRELQLNSATQVLPIQPDVEAAVWQSGAASAGNLENRGASDNTFRAKQVILQAYRLISQSFMDNHVEEEVLVNLMPMLVESVARAHARAVDAAIINGNGTFDGIEEYAAVSTGGSLDLDGATIAAGNSAALTAGMLMAARKQMGKYGINPADVAYIVSQKRYYDLIADPEFTNIDEVGSDVATKITGMIGAVFGSPVIISDNFATEGNNVSVGYAVSVRNYVIPRLRGVTVEQDYEVGNQRRVIVATQSLGFNELVADDATNRSAVKVIAVS